MPSKSQLFHPSPGTRTGALNDTQSAVDWNEKRKEAAGQEFDRPVLGLLKSIKDSALSLLRGAGKFATDLVAHPAAIIANTGRMALDVITKIPARIALTASDIFSEKTFGKVSALARRFREKVHSVLTPAKNSLGNGHRKPAGHESHGAAAAHGGGETPAHG